MSVRAVMSVKAAMSLVVFILLMILSFYCCCCFSCCCWYCCCCMTPNKKCRSSFFLLSFRLLFGVERTIGRKYDLPKLFFLLNLNGTLHSTHSPLSTLPASPVVKIARVNTQMVEKSLTWNLANLIFNRIASTSFVFVFLKKCLPIIFFFQVNRGMPLVRLVGLEPTSTSMTQDKPELRRNSSATATRLTLATQWVTS